MHQYRELRGDDVKPERLVSTAETLAESQAERIIQLYMRIMGRLAHITQQLKEALSATL